MFYRLVASLPEMLHRYVLIEIADLYENKSNYFSIKYNVVFAKKHKGGLPYLIHISLASFFRGT